MERKRVHGLRCSLCVEKIRRKENIAQLHVRHQKEIIQTHPGSKAAYSALLFHPPGLQESHGGTKHKLSDPNLLGTSNFFIFYLPVTDFY